jgi:hypothetical protein
MKMEFVADSLLSDVVKKIRLIVRWIWELLDIAGKE